MIAIRTALAGLLILWAAPAWAIESGTASGHYAADGPRIEVSHAIALRQDNTEGLLEHDAQVRVLLSDRAEPVGALLGVAFPPAVAMARQGAVVGLLIEFDPTNRSAMRITVLEKADDPTASSRTITLADSNGLWRDLKVDDAHVEGVFQSSDGTDLAFSFNAPLSTDPVVADLKGADALSSEPVRVLVARAEAIKRDDLPAALALSSRAAGADLKAMSPDELKQVSASAGDMLGQLKAVKRVVVRRKTAVAMMADGSWSNLVLEDGGWKDAD